MPFTLEQIRKALTPYRTDYFEKLGVNAIAVADYLTGKSATLPPLIHMYDNGIFFYLTTLLHKKNAWNQDDEMIINVFNDPLLLQEAYTLMARLRDLKLDITKPGDSAEIMFIMNKLSLSPQRKFEILYNYFYGSIDESEGNEVLAFIGNYMRKADNNEVSDLINTARRGHYAEVKFLLFLRMFRPDRYDDYALPKLVRQEGTIDHAVAYDMLLLNPAKYGPIIYKAIRNQEANKIHLRKNLDSVVYLYNANPSEYYSLMIEACEQYVEYFRQVTDFWEQNTFLTDNRDPDQVYPYSGYALYQLSLQNRDNGLEKAKQFIKAKGYMNAKAIQLLKQVLGEEVLPFIIQSLRTEDEHVSKDYHASILPLLKDFEPSLFLEQLWETVNHKNKTIRETIGRELCTLDPDIKTKAIALLDHKKAEQRQLGAYILSYIGEPDTVAALQQAADTESNDDARDIMLQSMSPETFQYKSLEDVKKVVDLAAKRGKLKKPSIKWLQTDLPPLYLNDGSEATTEFVNFLFYRMGRVKEMRSDIEMRDAVKFIDREKSSAFAKKIINLFFDNKAEARNKHILALGALAGDDEVVDKLRISIVNFIDDGRIKMAEAAVGALALQGSDKALRWVEFFSRKYRNKKANVGAAAQQALENAAEELGITTHELGDRIVPDFGFDGLFRHFTIDGEEYRAFIDSNFKIAFFNADDKKIKSIPAAAPAELKDEFKAVAKEV